MPIALPLHLLAVILWVGGMAFAYLIVRPAAGGLDPLDRMQLWLRIFGRFLPLAGIMILIILASGYWMVLGPWGGARGLPPYLHLMQAVGWVMIAVYLYLLLVPWPHFRGAVAEANTAEAARHLASIRRLVGANTALGLLNAAIGAGGRFLVF